MCQLNVHRSGKLGIALLVGAGCIAGLAVLYYLSLVQRSYPGRTDEAIRMWFSQHRSVFGELRDQIISEHSLRGVGTEYLCCLNDAGVHGGATEYRLRGGLWRPDSGAKALGLTELLRRVGLPSDRYDRYQDLLRQAGAERLVWLDHPSDAHAVQVVLYMEGLVPSGQGKSIVWFPKDIPSHYQVVSNTDSVTGNKGEWYASLGEGWYILHERW